MSSLEISIKQKQNELANPNADWHNNLMISIVIIAIIGLLSVGTNGYITGFLFYKSDFAIGFLSIIVFIYLRSDNLKNFTSIWNLPVPKTIVLFGSISLIIGGWIGYHLIMNGYNLSQDEKMTIHDAAIFSSGRFAIQFPQNWWEMKDVINRDFNSTKLRWDLTVSGYRPVNAFLHSILMKLGMVHFTAPIMSALGMIATWRVTKRIWPDDLHTQSLAIIFFLLSAQVWAASMSTYAMSTLLGLNMIWLALFLRNDKFGYIGAIIVGFFAVGVHQVPYHPMFAGTFIALMLVKRRWLIFSLYSILYLLFILFWLRYEDFVSIAMGGGALKNASATISTTIASHVSFKISPDALTLTAANIYRFFTWQHLLLLPLIIVAAKSAVRDRNWLFVAMIIGCLIPPSIKFILNPYQGFGLGYRYEHGFIGITCISAAAGCRELIDRNLEYGRAIFISSVATAFVAMPWQLWNASMLNGQYAAVDRQMSALKTDFVIVNDGGAPFANDLANNRADLSNKPLRLLGSRIRPVDVARLCSRGTISLLRPDQLDHINQFFDTESRSRESYQRLSASFRRQCPENVK